MADDDLEAYLQQLPDDIRKPIADAVAEQAKQLSDAQRLVLQGLIHSASGSGNLEASCQALTGEDDLEWIVQAGGETTTGEVRDGSGEAFDYGEAFEYGTSRQPARPFFWPTYRERQEDIQQAIQEAIDEALR